MRKPFDGLSALVRNVLKEDPASGHLFVFINRRRSMMKVLYFDRGGYCIWSKRLERGRFHCRGGADDKLSLDWTGLKLILEGISVGNIRRHKRYRHSAEPRMSRNGFGFRGMFRLGHGSFLECVNDGNIIVAPRSRIRQGWTMASLLFRITRPPVPQRNGASTVTGFGVKRKPLLARHPRITALLADQQPDGLHCPGIARLRDPAAFRSAVPPDRRLRDAGGVAGWFIVDRS